MYLADAAIAGPHSFLSGRELAVFASTSGTEPIWVVSSCCNIALHCFLHLCIAEHMNFYGLVQHDCKWALLRNDLAINCDDRSGIIATVRIFLTGATVACIPLPEPGHFRLVTWDLHFFAC